MHLRKRVDTIALPPPPISVAPSGDFDGNDGRWSSFFINVASDTQGLNGQNFKVLISTSSSLTLLPARTEWCNSKCAAERGVALYNNEQVLGVQLSGQWADAGIYEVPLPYWYPKEAISTGNGTLGGSWGKTNIGLERSSPSSLVIAERYAVKYIFEDFFMGSFGLAVGAVGPSQGSIPTFLTQMEDDGQIASSSFGYTAGAWYRNNGLGEPGSLVLGGYDQSRMSDHASLSVRMPDEMNNTLVVGVSSVTYTPDPRVEVNTISYTSLCSTGVFRATIDSILPYLILPDCICDKFQEHFGLTYDEDQNVYFVNNTMHEKNLRQNATIDLKVVGGLSDSAEYTTIKLGYPAFDHQLSSITGENATNYFPIQRSRNGVFVLGRTFLQEAYIIVDYERFNFTVAPAYYSDPMPSETLKVIYNTSYTPYLSTPDSSGGLAPGAIAGTVVGIVVAFAIAGIIAFCWWKKRKSKAQAAQKPYETSQIDPTLAGQEIKYRRVSELTGSDLPSSPKTPVTGYYSADHKSIPPISEMSPESPPVELYSPPLESASDIGSGGNRDYFAAGKPHRRDAQRDRTSSGPNTPGTPIAELPGDEGQFYTPGTQFDAVSPLNSPLQSRGPSDTSLSTNIDERLADNRKGAARPVHPTETVAADEELGPKNETQDTVTTEVGAQRRPSHQRGLSDTTIASDSTAVSQPTPEEQERWAKEARRPLSE
ncbi:aspartic peptidase domain-containing protein [Boeremia exigua]|uniref:aspartic peptidase domain-containing protein n=1 Tax=Boeremia exigua TaxID=749465 RepID=UPI001E8CC08F|nr:aspartic peptidase domain-containing protein [Boeremia exigua]KAH6642121.1 aspartic peptidase domain-containing protein [Boeremia exigua]